MERYPFGKGFYDFGVTKGQLTDTSLRGTKQSLHMLINGP